MEFLQLKISCKIFAEFRNVCCRITQNFPWNSVIFATEFLRDCLTLIHVHSTVMFLPVRNLVQYNYNTQTVQLLRRRVGGGAILRHFSLFFTWFLTWCGSKSCCQLFGHFWACLYWLIHGFGIRILPQVVVHSPAGSCIKNNVIISYHHSFSLTCTSTEEENLNCTVILIDVIC